MSQSESIKELASALAKAQGEFPAIEKNKTAKIPKKTGGDYSYQYADLADIIRVVTPALTKYGLSVTQSPTLVGDKFVLETVLMHASGEWRSALYPLMGHERAQEQGSEITYARRYALCPMLGIHGEEDDDGKAASDAPRAQATRPRPPEIPHNPHPIPSGKITPPGPSISSQYRAQTPVTPAPGDFNPHFAEDTSPEPDPEPVCQLCGKTLLFSNNTKGFYCPNYKDRTKGVHSSIAPTAAVS
jgi:hypothetical protein